MRPAIFWSLTFLAVTCMAIAVQQGIRLVRQLAQRRNQKHFNFPIAIILFELRQSLQHTFDIHFAGALDIAYAVHDVLLHG